MTDLGELNGGFGSTAYAVNNAGAAAGDAEDPGRGYHAVVFSGGSVIDLGTMQRIDNTQALGINSSMQTVGVSYIPNNNASYKAFVYQNGVMTDIGSLGGSGAGAYGINDSGQIVGWSYTSSGVMRAFLYSAGFMQDLGTLGGSTSFAYAIDNAGEVVGVSDMPGGVLPHAFLYSQSSMRDLGVLMPGKYSEALGINNVGQVVGTAGALNQDFTAFVYSNGVMRDLNQLVDSSGASIYVNIAVGINDKGYIATQGSDDDANPQVLLSPYWIDVPTAYQIGAGKYVSGTLASLANIDKNYLVVQSGPSFSNGSPPLSIVLTGTSTLASPTDVRMNLTSHTDSVDLNETVEFYDYVAGAWVLVDSTTATTSDSTVAAISTNPARFVQSGTLQVKARISLKPSGPISKSPWSLFLDQAVWNVSP